MPLGTEYADQNCPIARSLEVIGERWTLLILRDAFYGRTRFDEFQRSLGIATNVLSTRLQKLVEAGILEQPAGARGQYGLSTQGRDLLPVLLSLRQWGEAYDLNPGGPSIEIVHAPCGHRLSAETTCGRCGEPIVIEELRITA